MTLVRAAPGPQLSAGRLRVDAARAIAKLREYQLVDRTAWVLEAIRAAVASGATKIELRGDANDVWLAWQGPPWPVAELPRLFDELVSPEPTDERHHLRLLAAAVNSALGMAPAYVDVYTNGPDGALRARYTPDVLDETDEPEESALRRVAAVPAKVPAELAMGTGMLVHLRRRAAVGMLTYLFWEREPPELAVARAACRDIAVPLTAGGVACHRDLARHDLARLPLGDNLDGFIALVDPAAPRPAHLEATLEVAEHGVVLAVYPLAIGPLGGPAVDSFELRAPVPIRVFLDAKRMPTNASRSQVRREVHPISTAEARAAALSAKLVADLAVAAKHPDATERTRAVALSLIAAAIGGPGWSALSSSAMVGTLSDVLLLRDATGVPRGVGHSWDGRIYTGAKALAAELGPWLSAMLWIPRGDPAAALVHGVEIDKRDTKRKIRWARTQHNARRRFLAHARRPATIAAIDGTPRLRAPLGSKVEGSCVPDHRFADFTGELAVSFDRIGGDLTVMYDGRPIERIDMMSAIGYVATIDSTRLTPRDGYGAVARDHYFTRAELAVKGALVCAAEVIALELDGKTTLPAGYIGGPHAPYDVEARLVRVALGIAHELPLQSRPTILERARVWRTVAGSWIDFAEIAKQRVIGFSTGFSQLHVPKGRLVLPGGREQIAKLLPDVPLVDYDHVGDTPERANRPALLAAKLAEGYGFALEIEDGEYVGAIAPTGAASSVRLHHVGRALEARPYTPAVLFGAAICVDSDAIVPDGDWRTCAVDPAGVATRDFGDWEHRFVRAAARTLAGDRPRELHGPVVTGLDNQLARALLLALARPEVTLDPQIVKPLRAAKLVHVLGERAPISIDELVKRFPKAIPVVDKLASFVEGYTPLVADMPTAIGIGKLAGVPIIDGTADLELRRRTALRNRRIAAHRAQAPSPLAFPHPGEHVPLAATHLKMTGLVGVYGDKLEVHVRIEDRPFAVITHPAELPLFAMIDLDPAYADSTFEGIAELLKAQIVDVVRKTAAALLIAIANARPATLAELGAARTLLAAYLEREGTAISPDVRIALCAAPAFVTLQGSRISLNAAIHPRNALRIARWTGRWIECSEDESPSPLDEGVLRAPDPNSELDELLRQLFDGSIVDVTDEVSKLQSQRRMAQGLTPPPSLPHVSADLKRSLASLGSTGKALGHGEIGLVSGIASSVFAHADGMPRSRLTLDVFPAIHLAIEAPDLAAGQPPTELATLNVRIARPASEVLSKQAQELATALLREIVGPAGDRPLPQPIRRSVRRALLSARLPPDLVRSEILELADETWVPLQAAIAQIDKYGNAWAVPKPTDQRPLEAGRLLFVLAPEELAASSGHYAFVDARNELALDECARANREKPKAATLELGNRDYILARGVLDGDGVTAPRGTVGALMPYAVEQRGLYTHQEMHPFESLEDPCRWPTIAFVDDARLEPDRTWAKPKHPQPALSEVGARVSAASERALAQLVRRPSRALAHSHVGVSMSLGKLANTAKLQVRGAVSLVGAPRPPQPAIEVCDAYGQHRYIPQRPLGMVGRLYVYAREGWQRGAVLDDMLGHLYGVLVKQLIGRTDLDADLVSAHVANAIFHDHITPAEARATKFECFLPMPLDACELALLRRPDAYRVRSVAEIDEPEGVEVIDDGSETSRVVIGFLGPRARRGPRVRVARPPEPTATITPPGLPPIPPPISPPMPPAIDHAAPAPRPARPPEPEHAIKNLVDAVHRRLVDFGIPTFGVRIVDVESPIVRYADQTLRFAGRDARLHAVANAMRANSPWAPLAVDAVIAHAITVLNEARTEVTDDTERHVLKSLLIGT